MSRKIFLAGISALGMALGIGVSFSARASEMVREWDIPDVSSDSDNKKEPVQVAEGKGKESHEGEGERHEGDKGDKGEKGEKGDKQAGEHPEGGAKGAKDAQEGTRSIRAKVHGVVVSKGENNTFNFKVSSVLGGSLSNVSFELKTLVGKTLEIHAKMENGEQGPHKDYQAMFFNKMLHPGLELGLDICNEDNHGWELQGMPEGPKDPPPPGPKPGKGSGGKPGGRGKR